MKHRKSKRILSSLLALAMCVTLFPAGAFAEEADTRALPDPVDGVITLTENVTLSDAYTVEAGETVTIDLAGHTLTNADNKHTIINKGTLTINDSKGGGVVDNVSHARAAVYNDQTGVVTLNGGTYDRSREAGSSDKENGSNSYYTLKNFGKMTINAGVTVQQDGTANSGTAGKYSSLIANGWYNIGTAGKPGSSEPACPDGAFAELTINGGTFKGGLNTIKNDDRSIATIENGTFENFAQAVVQNHNILTINGGNYDAAADGAVTYGVENCGCAAEHDLGTLTITGGTFSASYGLYDRSSQPAQVNVSGGDFSGTASAIAKTGGSKASISVTGGSYSTDVSSFVAENYEIVEADGSYKVQKMENKLVVTPSTDEGNVSASLEGAYVDSNTTVTEDGKENTGSEVDNTGVTVDLTTTEGNSTDATLTVTAETAQSLAQHNAPSLSVKTDVGTVVLDQTALGKMRDVTAPVVVSVANTTADSSEGNIAAEYTVSVTSGNNNLLPDGAANGTVTITLPVDQADLQPWYVTGSGIYAEKLPVIERTNDSITFTIGHLSTIQLLKADPETSAIAFITKADGTKTYYTSATELQDAVKDAGAGDTIDLLADVTIENAQDNGSTVTAVFHVNSSVTINGNGHTIAYNGSSTINHIINVNKTADAATINDLVIDATGARYGVQFYCTKGGSLNNVTINNGSYAAVNINGAQNVTITDSTLNPSGYANIDYSMGTGVNTIPGIALDNVSMKNGIMQVWADETTVTNMKNADGTLTTNDAVMDKITSSIDYTSPNGGSLQVTVNFGEAAGGTETGSIDSTYQPPYTGDHNYAVTVAKTEGGSVTLDKADQYANAGETITFTVTPDKGYSIDKVTVTQGSKAIDVTDNSDSTYSFTMPKGPVTITVTFTESDQPEPEPEQPFTDVHEDDWYYQSVLYVYNEGLMTGTAKDTFSPGLTTTRGMIVSILHRQEGEPAAGSNASFSDVTSGAYYEDAVNWAAAEGIVNGYSDSAFGPNDAITREQMAAILMNYAQYKGQDVSARADLSAYSDAESISAWAEEAMSWAHAEGLINGMSDTELAPKGHATRAQVAAILQRFLAE